MQQNSSQFVLISSIIIALCIFVGCSDKDTSTNAANIPQKRRELLIYCGITMFQPIKKLANIIEKENHCKVIIIKDASGYLLKSIRANKHGDIFLPGSDLYMKTAIAEGLILKNMTITVGHNQIAILVKKNNPLNISSDLANLADKKYKVVLGSPTSGSIGRKTKKILDQCGITNQAYQNALYLTADSKDLTNAIINNTADIVINWRATGFWEKTKPYISIIEIDNKTASKEQLVMGILKSSKHPKMATKFINLAASEKGKNIFKKFGF